MASPPINARPVARYAIGLNRMPRRPITGQGFQAPRAALDRARVRAPPYLDLRQPGRLGNAVRRQEPKLFKDIEMLRHLETLRETPYRRSLSPPYSQRNLS